MIAHDRSWLEVLMVPYRRTLERTDRGLDAECSAKEPVGQADNECTIFIDTCIYQNMTIMVRFSKKN